MCDEYGITVDVDLSLGKTMEYTLNDGTEVYNDGGTKSKDDERIETKDEKPKNSRFLHDFNWPEEILLLLGLIAIALDPLFFFVPMMKNYSTCLGLDNNLIVVLVILRTSVDILHDLSWWNKSGRCGKPVSSKSRRLNLMTRSKDYKTPSPGRMPNNDKISPPRGRSSALADRVINLLTWVKNSPIFSPEGRSSREARIMAIIASLPLPQVVVLAVDLQSHLKTWIKFCVICQFVPRILRCYPTYMAAITSYQMYAWIGAAFNLLLFALVSHAVGSFWYLRSVERRMDCMEGACRGLLGCSESLLYCGTGNDVFSGNISDICAAQPTSNGTVPFDYGMFYDAIWLDLIGSTDLIRKVSGSFWWGINNISSSGLNISIGTYVWDAFFAIFICLLGLILYALLIGNAQLYLQSTRPSMLEKLKEKREKLNNWPPFFNLPKQLRKEVSMCQHPKWQEVSEVNLESLLNNIPWQLRRKLKPYFCKKLFHKVKEFDELNEKMKEALRERASVVVFQSGISIYTEGHPIHRMIHIVQGKVLTFSSNDANEGLPAEELKEDDSIGEELLLRALESPLPKHPLARKTIQSLTKVEAFALSFDDFVAVFTKYGRSMEPYRKEWAANTIKGAFRKFVTMQNWKKSYLE